MDKEIIQRYKRYMAGNQNVKLTYTYNFITFKCTLWYRLKKVHSMDTHLKV